MQLPQPIQSNQGNRLKLSYLGLAVRVRGVSGWLGKQSIEFPIANAMEPILIFLSSEEPASHIFDSVDSNIIVPYSGFEWR